MLTTEHSWHSTTATASPTTCELRLQVGNDERRLPISRGKHSIGSGPRCSLRLDYPGVQPLECLIVHDEDGLRVRRWSDNSTLNGQSFDDSRLTPGDVLRVGPAELEILAPPPESAETELAWSATDAWDSEPAPPESESPDYEHNLAEEITAPTENDRHAEHAFELSPQVLQPTEANLDWENPEQVHTEPVEETAESAAAGATAPSLTSESPTIRIRSNRRVRAALDRQRKQYDQLVARVDDLERKIAEALTEPLPAVVLAESQLSPMDDSEAIERDRRQAELESQLTQVRQQLDTRDRELHQARYSIDMLERQLIDSQRTMNAFAEARLHWESQFNELEARLAEYVERIQELEHQLDNVRASQPDTAPPAVAPCVEWATEPPVEQATTVDVVNETVCDAADDTCVVGSTVGGESVGGESVDAPVAEEVAPVEVADAATSADHVVAASLDGSADVDVALDHLRGLSIWREEPQMVSEFNVEPEPPATDDTPTNAANSQPASFIDRYAHLFPSNDGPVEPVHQAAPPVHEFAPPAAKSTDDEESVEQYMARLLERMRGPGNGDTASAREVTPREDASVTSRATDLAPVQEPITDLSELKTKPTVSELASHRQAMRELAMQSARQAIGVHASRKLRRNTQTRAVVAVLGAAVAAYLLITAPGWKTLQFAGACIAGFVALYWGKLTVSTILEGIRLGAFDDYEDELDADKAIHPPLPIDVEPTAHVAEAEANGEAVEHPEPQTNTELVACSESVAAAEPVGHTDEA